MSAEVHRDIDALPDGVEDAWRAFAELRENAFVSPEWARAWLGVFGGDATPAIAVSRGSGGVVRGIVPMVRTGGTGGKVLRFAGFNLGDVFHPACAPADEREVAAECFAALLEAAGADAILLDHVPAEADWPAAAAEAGGLARDRPYRDDVLPWIDLEGLSWEDFLAGRSRNLRSQIRRKTKALERDHEAVFRTASAETLEADLAALVRLHDLRWRDRGGSGALGERPRRFHEAFTRAALRRGWLRLWVLDVRGEPAAALYGWRLGDRFSYYQAGFDPAYERQSIGLVLLARTVRAAADEGALVYDLLRGGEAYKSRLAERERAIHSAALARPGSISRLALGAEMSAWRLSRRLGPERRARLVDAYGRLERFMPGGRNR